VFLYSERKSQKFLVIDGQQRLRSIFYFFEGFFGTESRGALPVFRLTGLSPDSIFDGKTFQELQDEDKRKLKNSVLRSFIVQQLDPADDTSMYHIFERLNTGGTLLANQEIRDCIYRGNFIGLLDDINTLPAWRRILGKDAPDTRRKDIELLVRFFSMRDISAYKKPMKDFLSKFMRKNRDALPDVLAANKKLFERTCNAVILSLTEKPFHIRAGLNTAVFDAVMTAFSKHLDEIPVDIRDRYERLKGDEIFNANTQTGTTQVDTVKRRLNQAEKVLFS
jgi:hypothetical protein